MPITAKPEILRPRSKAARDLFDDDHLDLLSHLLDDFIRIPGTPIRFGLDGIVGFIPGIGDLIGGLASTIIIVAAWSRGSPATTSPPPPVSRPRAPRRPRKTASRNPCW